MKQVKLLGLILALVFFCAACAQPSSFASPSGVIPKAGNGGQDVAGTEKNDETGKAKNGILYDPGIYVIEASDRWRQEIAEGYYADYECEMYLHKLDVNDNRSSAGVYTGFFWLKTTLDTAGFMDDMLGDAPVDISFAAGGEGICDNLGFSLNERDEWERGGYALPMSAGGEIKPGESVLADKGSFIVVAGQAYLDAAASGVQGESLEHHDSKAADVELSYIVHMQPDAYEKGTERNVTIHLYDNKGVSFTVFGKMRRLPGYPDDVARYTQNSPLQEALRKHLE